MPNTAQAIPWLGLPAGTNGGGNSHRWDSGAGGRIQFLGGAPTNSTGMLWSQSAYTGAYAKTYLITITASGNAGTATFHWTATLPGGGAGTNLLTGTNVLLNDGIAVTFVNGTNTSFQANDQWNIYVRPDLRTPTNSELATRMINGTFTCSTCHDQHSQAEEPFDPAAPPYNGQYTGAGRHFMRIANDSEQLCLNCHAARNVTNAVSGSHAVGVALSAYTNQAYGGSAYYRFTTNLPLELISGNVRCETCHQMHFAASSDGALLARTNITLLCVECHALADSQTPAAHFSATNGNLLWPGGQYGSAFPQVTDASRRGDCDNCHQPHGWPDASNPNIRYPKLLVESGANLCLTCHDTNGPSVKNVMTDFADTYHHPIKSSEQTAGRSVTCIDCHNPHQAMAGAHTYASTNKPVSAVTNSGTGLIRVAAAGHGFVDNDTVLVAGVGGVAAANGTWQVKVLSPDTFDLLRSAFSGTYTSGGTAAIVANTNRNLSPNPLKGASGVIVNYSGLTNFEVIATNRLAWIAEGTGSTNAPGAAREHQVCFKCHSSYSFASAGDGTANFTSGSTTVSGNGTVWTSGLIGQWIARSNDPGYYVITSVVSATSLSISPAYRDSSTNAQNFSIFNFPPGLTPLYNAGTATFTSGSTTVSGSGVVWNTNVIGALIRRTNETTNYRIVGFTSATSIQIIPAYSGATVSGGYVISLSTDSAQEFSPYNKSGHPVVIGLSSYSNSTAVGSPSLRGLQTAAMKAPWANNVGTQTMMCSDCHNTDASSPAAQGPHGSAAQYMLRGTNAANWPNVQLSSIATSWCMNCHNNSALGAHTGNHNSLRCYNCHIIVPHGGKISRLIADRDGGMPARYAFNNTPTNVYVQSFTKSGSSYQDNNCRTSCGHHSSGSSTSMENW